MANIKKISGTDVDIFGAMDGVNQSDMLTIDDVGFEFPFVFTVDTSLTTATTSPADQFQIPIDSGTQNFTVFWGDGTSSNITGVGGMLHTYPAPGVYTISIYGQMQQWRTNSPILPDDYIKLTSIERWGTRSGTIVFDLNPCFQDSVNLTSAHTLIGPNWTGNMSGFFNGCTQLDASVMERYDTSTLTTMPGWDPTVNDSPDFNSWDTSNWTTLDMRGQRNPQCSNWFPFPSPNFTGGINMDSNRVFNRDVSGWDVSNLTSLSFAFYGTRDFQQDVGGWDVGSVTNFNYFMQARQTPYAFDLSNWKINTDPSANISFVGFLNFNIGTNPTNFDTRQVTVGGDTYLAWDMQRAQNLSNIRVSGDVTHWDTSNATNLASFMRTWGTGTVESQVVTVGTGPTARTYTTWDVSKVTNFTNNRIPATGNPYNWKINTSADVIMSGMINGVNNNVDLSTKEVTVGASTYIAWDTQRVTNFSSFFNDTPTISCDVSNWNTDSATTFGSFHVHSGASVSSFNPDLTTKQVTVGTVSPITYISWDMSAANSITRIMYGANGWNGDVSNWNVSVCTDMNQAFYKSTLFNSNMTKQSVTVGTGPTARTYDAWDVRLAENMSGMLQFTAFNNTSPSTWELNSITNISDWCDASCSDANLETIMYAWSLNPATNSGPAGTVDATDIGGAVRTYSVGSNMDLALNDPTNGLVAAKGWNVTNINIV